MGEIREKFDELMDRRRFALIPFIMAGDPSPKSTVKIARVLERAGADMIELGLCFSDPIADGPTIQAASQRALESGVTSSVYFRLAKQVHREVSVPLIALTYYNMVLRRGIPHFFRDCRESGIGGVIIPDLSVDEAGEFRCVAENNGIDTIFLAAPISSAKRLKMIVRASTGFVYLVSVLGVTGARRRLSKDLMVLVERIKAINCKTPVAVGFGVSLPSHVVKIRNIGADGAIVGSALVDIISKNSDDEGRMLAKSEGYFRSIKRATEPAFPS